MHPSQLGPNGGPNPDHEPDLLINQPQHVFEEAGLGCAPFRYIGCEDRVGPIKLKDGTEVGAPGQPMGTCKYCGQGIKTCCLIESADGKVFTVGTDCVLKTGDKGLKKEVDKHRREVRKAREDARIAATRARIEGDQELRQALADHPMPQPWRPNNTALEWATWIMANAGNAGKMSVVRFIDKFYPGSFFLSED
jgi:hypothetical protein